MVSVLQTLHAELDAAVLEAYGWSDLPASASETLLERLVALNAERAREEAAGHIRWLRPAFQNPQATHPHPNPPLEGEGARSLLPLQGGGREGDGAILASAAEKSPWPATLPEQMALLARLLTPTPQSEVQLAARIDGKGPWKKRLPNLLQTLVALGRARQEGEAWVTV